jgi:hypothetical protein
MNPVLMIHTLGGSSFALTLGHRLAPTRRGAGNHRHDTKK